MWDGNYVATTIKPWLEDLRQWRELTVNTISVKLAAWKLQMSFPEGSWMRRCANMVPREQIMSNHGWHLIFKEIIYACKPYIDAELDIALERFLYMKKRPTGQSFAQFLTQLKKLREDVCDILGHEEIKCPCCEHVERRKHKIP